MFSWLSSPWAWGKVQGFMLLRGRHDGEGECYHTSTTHSRRNFFSVSKNSLSIPSLIFLGREGLINQWLQNSKPCLGDLAPHIGMWEWLAFIIPGALAKSRVLLSCYTYLVLSEKLHVSCMKHLLNLYVCVSFCARVCVCDSFINSKDCTIGFSICSGGFAKVSGQKILPHLGTNLDCWVDIKKVMSKN